MRHNEIIPPTTHAHLVTVRIDPLDLRRHADNGDDVALGGGCRAAN